MKALVLGAFGAAILLATPSYAQDFRIRAGEGGVSIRTDDNRYGDRYGERRWRERDRGADRVIIRDRRPDRVVIRERGECRDVTIRRERPDGSVVIRRERRCG